MATMEVCYEDQDIAVVWKPYGMSAIDTGRAELNLSSALPYLLQSAPAAADAEGASAAAPAVDTRITAAVNEMWTRTPCFSNQDMVALLQSTAAGLCCDLGTKKLKQQIKAAKAEIPYRRTADAPDAQPGFSKSTMVHALLEQRQSMRRMKSWTRADQVQKGLEALGIAVDDTLKTWTLGAAIAPQQSLEQAEPTTGSASCQMCGVRFVSRNLVFKHLRDPSNTCGLQVEACGGVPAREGAPSKRMKTSRHQVQGRVPAGGAEEGFPRLVTGRLLLEKWVAGLMIVAKTAAGWRHVLQHVDSCETSRGIQLEWTALVHGACVQCSIPPVVEEGQAVEQDGDGHLQCSVLQQSRGTHAISGNLTLLRCRNQLQQQFKSKAGNSKAGVDNPVDRVAPAVMRQFASAGHPVLGAQGGSGGSSSEQQRRTLSVRGTQGSGTTAASTASASGRGGKGKNTLLALVGLEIPPMTNPEGANPKPIRVEHAMPAKFDLLIGKEKLLWDQREREIHTLQRALEACGESTPEQEQPTDPESWQGLPLPAAYVAGCALFCGFTFRLGAARAVMVPRKSTEALVRAAVHRLALPECNEGNNHQPSVLDLGCGPGNVLLSVMALVNHRRKQAGGTLLRGFGIEQSEQALVLARVNAAALLKDMQMCVAFESADFGQLHHLPMEFWSRSAKPARDNTDNANESHATFSADAAVIPFDLIVCNPPYLDQALQLDLIQAAPELQAEPTTALFAADHGTAAYTAIVASVAASSPPVLTPNGVILFEVGKGMALLVQNAVASLGIAGCTCKLAEGPASLPATCGVEPHLGLGLGWVLEVSFERK